MKTRPNYALIKKFVNYALIAIGIGFVLSILAPILTIIIMFSTNDMCGTELYETVPSPNSELKAVIYERNCGATTPFGTNISIMESDATLENKGGNIYKSRGHPQHVAPQIYWESDNELVIVEQSPDKVYEVAESWGAFWSKITISYSGQ